MQQCGTAVEETGTFCVSLLTGDFESRDLDGMTEGIPGGRIFLFSDPGCL